jgi:hypothetical protein
MSGLKVTAAHEFNHAIQLGNFGYWPNDLFFYEITSTWLEDVVYHGVNDYFQYIRSSSDSTVPRGQFATPEVPFASFSGLLPYSRMIWGKFIEKKFSSNVMLQTWFNIRQYAPITAMDYALANVGSSFREAFVEWVDWNAHTAASADPQNYYTEGTSFPKIRERERFEAYRDAPAAFSDSIGAISASYRTVCVLQTFGDSCTPAKQMLVKIINLNLAQEYTTGVFPFIYKTSYQQLAGYSRLANGLYVALVVPDPTNWSMGTALASVSEDVLVYPNPYRASKNPLLTFRLPTASVLSARLDIYTADMNLVNSQDLSVTPLEFLVRWRPKNLNGEPVATGVYVFVLTVGEAKYIGKFAVIRE